MTEKMAKSHHFLSPIRFPWVMSQTWNKLLFAHWPVPAEAIRGLVPDGLAVDTYEGSAWIGIVAFGSDRARLRGLPPIPGISRFPEVNVRTYVTCGNRRGVLFLSMDAAHRLAAAFARKVLSLPYHYAQMKFRAEGEATCVFSRRAPENAQAAEFEAVYRPTGGVFSPDPGSLAHWLTSRYALYACGRKGLYRLDIYHPPWSLRQAEAKIARNTLLDPLRLHPLAAEPLCHYAERMQVVAWLPAAASIRSG